MKWLGIILAAAGLAFLTIGFFGRRRLRRQFALTPESRDRVKPRLVTPEFFDKMKSRLGALPSRNLYELPLKVVYVLDAPEQMMYLSDDMLKKLQVAPDDVHALALTNLRKSMPARVADTVFVAKSTIMMKSMDGFDAARILLVPEVLSPGQRLAAVIPDRDTLGLLPIPDDWSTIEQLARSNVGDPLFDCPLLVTSSGVSAPQ
jgi:hypothetical protein